MERKGMKIKNLKPSAKRLEDFLREEILPIAGVLKIYWGVNLWESPTAVRWCLMSGSPLISLRMIKRTIVIIVEDGASWPIREEINKVTNNTGLILGRPYEVLETDISPFKIL